MGLTSKESSSCLINNSKQERFYYFLIHFSYFTVMYIFLFIILNQSSNNSSSFNLHSLSYSPLQLSLNSTSSFLSKIFNQSRYLILSSSILQASNYPELNQTESPQFQPLLFSQCHLKRCIKFSHKILENVLLQHQYIKLIR